MLEIDQVRHFIHCHVHVYMYTSTSVTCCMAPPCEWYGLVLHPKSSKNPQHPLFWHSRSLNSVPIKSQCTTFY